MNYSSTMLVTFLDSIIMKSDSNSWNLIDSKGRGPIPRCYHTAWSDGNEKFKLTNNIIEGHFFIYGGKQSDKGQLSDVFCFNIESLAWKKFFTMEAPLPRSQHVSVRS